jgi:hypothetical protein
METKIIITRGDDMKDKINPIIQVDDTTGKIDPIMRQSDINEYQYVITKRDREHVRADKIFVCINGINIYADIDDAIMVNTINNEVYIYRHEELAPAEEREYLILLVYNDENIPYTYQGMVGRQETFDYIVENAEIINFDESKILAETTKLKDMISLYAFVKMCIDQETVKNPTGFDPDDYGTDITDMEDEDEQ